MNWTQFCTWIKSKNITTHSVGAALLAFAIAYTESSWLRGQIGILFVGHPVIITKLGIIAGDTVIVAGIWAKFSHSSSPAGVVEAARSAAAKDASTTVQADAADTSAK
jgi:fructose-1-phosphate kinase PfkB-like protein